MEDKKEKEEIDGVNDMDVIEDAHETLEEHNPELLEIYKRFYNPKK